MKPWLLFTAMAAFSGMGLTGGKAQEMMMNEKPAVVPTPAAKPLSRAEEILIRFDRNADGRLDDDEKTDAHHIMLLEQMAKEAPPPERRGLGYLQSLAVELFDRNQDAKIDEEERAAATAFLEHGDPAVTREALLIRSDRNRDGKLDEVEERESRAFAVEHLGELMHDVLLNDSM